MPAAHPWSDRATIIFSPRSHAGTALAVGAFLALLFVQAPAAADGPTTVAELETALCVGDGATVKLVGHISEPASILTVDDGCTATLDRDGAEWLAARRPRCVGYDFPQDHPIRGIVNGSQADAADFVTHDVLLRAGVGMVEYLANLSSIEGQRTFFVAMPLRIAAGDGSPVRAIAVEF